MWLHISLTFIYGLERILIARVPRDILVLGVIVLASFAGFGLGFLAGQDMGQGSEILLQDLPPTPLPVSDSTGYLQAGQVVASKNGTKYYFPKCSGVSRITEANKVWFTSPDAAMAAGYTLAANCTAP